jgi:hypothetical protein
MQMKTNSNNDQYASIVNSFYTFYFYLLVCVCVCVCVSWLYVHYIYVAPMETRRGDKVSAGKDADSCKQPRAGTHT